MEATSAQRPAGAFVPRRSHAPRPLCLPTEHMHGYWSEEPTSAYAFGKPGMRPRQYLRGVLNRSATWEPISECVVPTRGPPQRVLRHLQQRNATLVFSGNSIMRHVFFRFASFLRGVPNDEFSQDERQVEKQLCSKDLSTARRLAALSHSSGSSDRRGAADATGRAAADGARGSSSLQQALSSAGNFRKPYCKSGCCGVCSCASSVGSLTLYFIWQQEWFDERMRKVWNELLGSEPLRDRQPYLVMNAGLVHARAPSLPCILNYQFPLLREYLVEQLPTRHPRARTIYLASPTVQGEEADAWMGAQDGMLRSLFSAMPAARRPIWLDARAATADWVDFIDVNHFGGKSAQVIIEALVHLAVHWEELYSEGGRGWRYERRRTKRLNQYDSGPSSASWLGKVHAEIDEGIRLRISPPPAHSKREDCY